MLENYIPQVGFILDMQGWFSIEINYCDIPYLENQSHMIIPVDAGKKHMTKCSTYL